MTSPTPSQPMNADPAELWEQYLAETGEPSPQGALAFAADFYLTRIEELESEQYLVFSNLHGAWWRANSSGYTTDIRGAGFYSREEAISISGQSRDGWENPGDLPCELAIPISALPEKIRAVLQSKGAA